MPMPAAHDLAAILPYVLAAFIACVVSLSAKINNMGLFSAPIAFASSTASASMPSSTSRPRHRARTRPDDPGDNFPGMVNLSGTLCYMNSVLQAFASLSSLLNYLDRVIAAAERVDVPTPVCDALYAVLSELNTGHAKHPTPLRPHELLAALSPLPQIRRLLATREQQDAHELFIVLAEAVSDEAEKVAKEVARTQGGLQQAVDLRPSSQLTSPLPSPPTSPRDRAKSRSPSAAPSITPRPYQPPRQPDTLVQPWEGLLARRRVCMRCGYSDVVRLDTLGGMELPVPRSGDVTLDACISEYLAPERLSDVTCDMCTTRATLVKYCERAERLEGKKSRAHAAKVANRLRAMVEAGVVGNEGGAPKDIKWDIVRTDCLRETVVSRPPRTLRFHFVRSEYTPYGHLLKKSARVRFPLMFDLGPHMARGVWEPRAQVGSVAAALAQKGSAGTTASTNGHANVIGEPPHALYRLESAILHFGYAHSSGHFVAIRRKPGAAPGVPGKGWLRISDADVDEVGADELAASAAAVFMLFYERVDLPDRMGQDDELVEEPPVIASNTLPDMGHSKSMDDDEIGDDTYARASETVIPSFAGLGMPSISTSSGLAQSLADMRLR